MPRGSVPPIVTLVIVGAFVVGALVSMWLIVSIHLSCVRGRALLHIDRPVILDPDADAGPTLHINIRNDGPSPVRVEDLEVVVAGAHAGPLDCGADTIEPGETARCTVVLDRTVALGTEGILRTPWGALRFMVDMEG